MTSTTPKDLSAGAAAGVIHSRLFGDNFKIKTIYMKNVAELLQTEWHNETNKQTKCML